MRWLRRSLLLLGLVLGLPLGGFLHFIASNLHEAADIGRPTPQTIRLDQLVANGPGDNAHVEVTDFCFGTPIIDKEGVRWSQVWLPMQPCGTQPSGTQPSGTQPSGTQPSGTAKSGARPVVLRLGDSPDQARLDELLSQKKLTALVASSLSKHSIWQVKPSDNLQRAHPEFDAKTTLFLNLNPTIDLVDGQAILSKEQIFDRSHARVVRACAWSALAVAVACAVLLLRGLNWQRVDVPRPPAPPDEKYRRERLAHETPLSVHTFRFWGALGRSLLLLFNAVLFFGFALGTVAMAGAFTKRSEAVSAIVSVVLALGLLVVAFLMLGLAIKVFTESALYVEVCPGGLRWQKLGSSRSALWSDIAKCRRVANLASRIPFDSVAIVLYSGERLNFWDRSLSDYQTFVGHVMANFTEEGILRPGFSPSTVSLERSLTHWERHDWTG